MTSRLQHLLYVSACDDTLEHHAIHDMLAKARAYNAAHSVTGVLIYSGAHFAQVLEGPESELERLMASIRRDSRHGRLRTLVSSPLAERRFEGWSMGFVSNLSVADLLAELGSELITKPRAARLIDLLFRRAVLEPLG